MCNNNNILLDVTDDVGVVAELADIVAHDTNAVVGVVTDGADAVENVVGKVPGYYFLFQIVMMIIMIIIPVILVVVAFLGSGNVVTGTNSAVAVIW